MTREGMGAGAKRWGAVFAIGLAWGTARAHAAVPRPVDVFGFAPGTDYRLAGYEALVRYFRALDAASPRVSVEDIGPTAEGRRMIVAVITSEANHRRLAHLKQVNRRLALARGLEDAEARTLAAEGKAVVWIDCGLHATEVATAQHAPELAYRVATEESEEMRRIRDEVIFVHVPVMNPDGLDQVVAWYERNRGTPHEVAPMVELYQKHAGHDNNRDWYMFNLPESRNVARLLYEEWFPQIVYNHHQTAPFPARIFVPPYADPMNPNIPPLVMRGIHTVGDAITQRLEQEGKVGALSRLGFDTWWNGGMRTAPFFHNMVGILTETALWHYATPHDYDPAKLPQKFRDGATPTDTATTFYPSPWKGGRWRLRDAVEYMLTASLATLDIAARKKTDWLYGAYKMGRDALEAGRKGDPYAYVIPAEQPDPGTAAKLVEVLRRGGVEVQQASAPWSVGERRFASGSWVVPMSQPFRAYAKDLLEVQRYPERRQGPNGPPIPPYDVSGWTLPAQMGVEAVVVGKPFEASLAPVVGSLGGSGRLEGDGSVFLIGPEANDAYLVVNRILASNGVVRRATKTFSAGGRTFAPGAFAISGGLDRFELARLARERSLVVTAVAEWPAVEFVSLRTPRVGLYRPWVPIADEGWTRWVLEQFDFPYRSLNDASVRAGGLRDGFDVVVLADAPLRTLINGHLPGTVPEEFAGGLGLEGALALKEFVRAGGTLLTLDSASELAIDLFGLGMRDVLKGLPRQEYFCPGGILRLQVETDHPLAWGLPKEMLAFVENGPAFALGAQEDDGEERPPLAPTGRPGPTTVARFVDKDVLYSGWLLGETKVAKRGALVEVPLGQGRVVLVGFRPQFRGQSHGTFKVLFNALLSSRRAE